MNPSEINSSFKKPKYPEADRKHNEREYWAVVGYWQGYYQLNQHKFGKWHSFKWLLRIQYFRLLTFFR
jgi:hypothetical protein